ncbi:butyrophilin subfamily 2 member A2-like [Seriola dumerili]|uniref:butyrophilin subfamily 2 member A2-like n=1 Tax=Seriola dumerili TaxID=41447 RepID=UPI000BBECB49|nr:butyrophilin subfamily 2 member A2-like [Seriola dumerili]
MGRGLGNGLGGRGYVKLSDEGKYRCYIPAVQKDAFVQLVVGSVSSPVVKATNSTFSGVVLHCESKGWYPEPELLWLDGEGKLLSAGPTETVRGPDDLYTVSSRVTVEKRHSNNFTCRVQQKIINQTRETQIHVPDDFFMTQSTSSSPASIIGLVAGILIIISIITVAIIFRKRRKKKIKTSGNRGSNDETGQNRTQSGSDGAEVQPLAEGGETEKLRTENAESEHGGGESENYTHARDTVSYRGGKKGRAANDRGKGNLQRCC